MKTNVFPKRRALGYVVALCGFENNWRPPGQRPMVIEMGERGVKMKTISILKGDRGPRGFSRPLSPRRSSRPHRSSASPFHLLEHEFGGGQQPVAGDRPLRPIRKDRSRAKVRRRLALAPRSELIRPTRAPGTIVRGDTAPHLPLSRDGAAAQGAAITGHRSWGARA